MLKSIENWAANMFDFTIPEIHPTDIIEIAIIAFFIYQLLVWIKNTRAWMLFRGIMIVLVFFFIAAILQMNTILWLGEKLFSAGVIALIVVFQPELRRALEKLGRTNYLQSIFSWNMGKNASKRFEDKTLNDLVKGCFEMGAVKTGALIVMEQDVPLAEYERTGIALDSILSRQLLINIFEKNTPLHDGAVIVRGDRVISATCYLPLSDNLELSKDLGTRHRAAVGISEVTDALTIIVSEETGKVSIAQESRLIRDVSIEGLTEILKHFQQPDFAAKEPKKEKHFLGRRHAHED